MQPPFGGIKGARVVSIVARPKPIRQIDGVLLVPFERLTAGGRRSWRPRPAALNLQ